MESRQRRDDSPRRTRRPKARRGWNPVVVGVSVAGAVLVVAAIVVAVVYVGKARRGDPRLIGTWQSDADATIADLNTTRTVTDQQEQLMRKLFGRLKVTYTDKTLTTDLDGKVETHPYQVVRQEGDSVVVKSWSDLSKKDEEVRIQFVGNDTYWVHVPQANLRECFRRVK